MDAEKLAEALRRLRGSLSQAQAAKEAGVSIRTIGGLESGGYSNPSFESLARLCRVYGASLDALAVEVGLFPEETYQTTEASETMRRVREEFGELTVEEQRELADLLTKSVQFYEYGRQIKRRREETDCEPELGGQPI